MVVGLDLEGDGESVPDVDDPCIFLSGADEDFRRFGREGFEDGAGVFVGAVLAPHEGEDAQPGVIGVPSQDFLDLGVLLRG